MVSHNAVNKRSAAEAYALMRPAGKQEVPTRRREVEQLLDEARAKLPEQVALVETYLESSGFKAFQHGVSKLGASVANLQAAEQASGPSSSQINIKQAQAVVAAEADAMAWPRETGIRDLTIPERELLSTLRNLGTPKSDRKARIRALIDGAKVTAHFFDARLGGVSGHMRDAASVNALNQLQNRGVGDMLFVSARDFLYRDDVRQRFEETLESALRPAASAEKPAEKNDSEPPAIRTDPQLLFPKSPRGVVLGLRRMAEQVDKVNGDSSYGAAALAYSNAMTMGMRAVAEKLGASADEIKAASLQLFSESAFRDEPVHLMNTAEMQKKGEKWARSEFEKSYLGFLAQAGAEAKDRLSNDSAARVHPNVWARWVALAGGPPPLNCKAVGVSERSLAIARDFERDGSKKSKMVKDFSQPAAKLAELVTKNGELESKAQERLLLKQIKPMEKALSKRFDGPLPPASAAEFAGAYEALRSATLTVLGRGQEIDLLLREPLAGDYRPRFMEGMLQEANASGAIVAASWNGNTLYVLPGDSADTVEARYREDQAKPSLASSLLKLFGEAQGRAADELSASSFAATALQAPRPLDLIKRELERRLGRSDHSAHIFELSHPDEILAYGLSLEKAPPEVRRRLLDELHPAARRGEIVPGTKPAWNLVMERLARVPN